MYKKYLLYLIFAITIFSVTKVEALSAKSAVLYEPVTQRVLMDKNSEEKLPMASTTKIITAITAIENCDIKEIATTSYNASVTEGSSIWLSEGEKMTIEDLLYGLMLSSGNDAAVVIAEHISGSVEKFAELMNATSIKAGATNTNLTNPSGLDDDNHYTTAVDLAKITAYAMKNDIFRKIVSTKSKTIPWEGHEWDRKLSNHNKLLSLYEGTTGVKTGFTKKDGRCLVSSANKKGVELIAVTLNAPNDWNDHIEMLDYGFSLLLTKTLKISDYNLKTKDGVREFTKAETYKEITIPVLKEDTVEVKKHLPGEIKAPIKDNITVGYEEVYINNKKVLEIPVITKEANTLKMVFNYKYYIKKILNCIFLL